MHAEAAQHIVLLAFFFFIREREVREMGEKLERKKRKEFFFFSLGAIALSIHHVCENFNKPAKQSLSQCVTASITVRGNDYLHFNIQVVPTEILSIKCE